MLRIRPVQRAFPDESLLHQPGLAQRFLDEGHSQKTPKSANSTQHSMNVSIDVPSPNLQIEGHLQADNDMQICVLDQERFGEKPYPWLPKLL